MSPNYLDSICWQSKGSFSEIDSGYESLAQRKAFLRVVQCRPKQSDQRRKILSSEPRKNANRAAAPVTKAVRFKSFRNLFLSTLSPAIVGKRPNFSVKRTPLLREEVSRTVSGPAKIEEGIHSLCDALIASEGGLGR